MQSWLEYCSKSMTNREEDDVLLTVNTVGQVESPTQNSKTILHNKSDDESGLNGSEQSEAPIDGTTNISKTSESANGVNGVITEINWQENPPSSASPSSGFSDDDSLTGVNEVGEGKTILQVVEMVNQMSKKGLIDEYTEIRARQPDGTFDNARMRHNVTKNRYTDVLCYDHSRVILSSSLQDEDTDEQSSDYINANFGNIFLHFHLKLF